MNNTGAPKKNINISVCYDGKCYEIQTYTNEYRNLMMLIYDRIYTESFGECLGMGKCGTCLVEIMSSKHELSSYERNEETTLLKAGHNDKNVHLSCQLMIDEYMDGLIVNILY